MRSQIESLLSAVEDETGELKEADAAEMRMIEDIRRLGQESLQAWASHQVKKTSTEVHQGQQLFHCATRAGFGSNTYVHAVGDGADWIAKQVEERFGAQSRYLVDFYHVCDYLSAAAKAITMTPKEQEVWMSEQKERLKTHRASEVISVLAPCLEAENILDKDAPVRQCHRYLTNRLHQLNYRDALKNELPIGSGEIESAHRYIVQQRLKRPGSWWRTDNADHMLALRLNRANKEWNSYWRSTSV